MNDKDDSLKKLDSWFNSQILKKDATLSRLSNKDLIEELYLRHPDLAGPLKDELEYTDLMERNRYMPTDAMFTIDSMLPTDYGEEENE